MPQPSAPKIDVVGVGLNATDTLLSVSEFPRPGSKAAVRAIKQMPGGQVATALIACQRWGMRTRYIGTLGDDVAAKIHLEEFTRAGVETHIASVANCASAQSFIIVDPRGERTVLWRRDERLALQPEDLHREWIVNARALLVDGADTAAATQAARWAQVAGVPVFADLDEPYSGIESLLANIDYLIVSRDFPSKLSDNPDLRYSLPDLQRRFGCRLTAATLGAGGVLAWDGRQFHQACAYQVAAIDTTGAGDIFHAGFIFGLLQVWQLPQILDFACAAAALNCCAVGARGGIRLVSEIEDLMSQGNRHPRES